MKDIKLSKSGNVDYIPEDGILCEVCVFYDKCPWNYTCKTVERTREWERENKEL